MDESNDKYASKLIHMHVSVGITATLKEVYSSEKQCLKIDN